MFESENIYSMLKTAEIFLQSKGIFDAKPDAEVLLSSVLKIKRSKDRDSVQCFMKNLFHSTNSRKRNVTIQSSIAE